jgi:hypothetical protein
MSTFVTREGATLFGKRLHAPLFERARYVLRHAWRGDLPYEVQEVHDPPVVGRRVTDEHGSTPEAPAARRRDALRREAAAHGE